jgi:alkane 1-monooxygenase
MQPWPFLLLFVMPLAAAWFAARADLSWIALWLLALLVLPIADMVLPLDRRNPAPGTPPREAGRSAFTWIILAYVPVQFAVTAYVLWVASVEPMPWFERLGLVATLALSNGAIGLTVAHELVHRTNKFEFACGQTLLAGLCYPHYSVEWARRAIRPLPVSVRLSSCSSQEACWARLRAPGNWRASAWPKSASAPGRPTTSCCAWA